MSGQPGNRETKIKKEEKLGIRICPLGHAFSDPPPGRLQLLTAHSVTKLNSE